MSDSRDSLYVFALEEGVPRVVAEYASIRDAQSDFPALVVGEAVSALLSELPPESVEEAVVAYLQEKLELLEAEATVLREEVEAVSGEVDFLALLGDS